MEIKNTLVSMAFCYQNGKLLCIEKTRGPYQHRFDLPGGSLELGEGLTETLKRSSGRDRHMLSRYSNPRIYDVLVHEEGQDFAVHHIMSFYDIVLDFEGSQKSLPHEVLDGSNDSANAIWLPLGSRLLKKCLAFSIRR